MFEDDGGTRAWRANQATWGKTVDVYPNRRAAMRAYLRRHPFAYVAIGITAGLIPPAVLIIGLIGIVAWSTIHYWLFGTY